MFDRRRYLGTFAVLALVLLRLVIGWDFFRQGTQKVEYDRHDGQLRLDFSAEGFLKQARGPLAGLYHGHAPDDHGWQQTLASPRRNAPATDEEAADAARWAADYRQRRDEAAKNGEPLPFEFPPLVPYRDWAEQIAHDWRHVRDEVKGVSGLSDEQKRQADAALDARLGQLADYLASQSDAITEYRHELWRLANWRAAPEAGEVPFVEERIAAKTAETSGQPAAWVREVQSLESQFHDDLRAILTDEQRTQPPLAAAIDTALDDVREHRLETLNIIVTVVTIAVGACLLLGLFTRLASLVGALFLFGVIASQPPWLADALPTMPNVIELAGLLVLAATGAGRWLGLDYFTYALFARFRRHDTT
jgi:uncharacterized membrane protein YphA (DoxX/SURF4 family)